MPASGRKLRRLLRLLTAPAFLLLSGSPAHAWEYVLNPPRTEFQPPGVEQTFFNKLAVDDAGSVLACGVVMSGGPPPDLTVVKLSGADGTLLWRQVLPGSMNHRATSDCRALSVDRQGDVLVGGRVTVLAYDISQFVLMKIAGDTGKALWSRWLGDDQDRSTSSLNALAVDPAGDVIALGDIRTAGYGNIAIKFDGQTGTELWHIPAGLGYSSLLSQAITIDSRGDALIAGSEYLSRSFARFRLRKLSGADGREIWHYEQLRPLLPSVELSLDAQGDVVVADTTSVFKLSGATGGVQWIHPAAGATVSVDPSGNAIATLSGGAGVVKIDGAGGEALWRRIGDPALWLSDSGADSAGNVCATGFLRTPEADDLALLRLAGDTGQVRWLRTFSDDLGALGNVTTTDSAGDVLAAGYLSGIAQDWDGYDFEDRKAVVVKVWGRTGADFPPTPLQLLAALSDTVLALSLPRSIENGLMREVNAATAVLSDADPANDSQAADHLGLLIRRVTALRGRAIPPAGADEIISLARQAISVIAGA